LVNISLSANLMKRYFDILLSGLIRLCLILLPFGADAQYFAVGQDPGSIKWRQIQSGHFQIIFPSDYETEAQRVAQIFEKVYNYSGISLQHQPKKISVILHTKSMNSNGFVAWAPSRVELFPTPGQDSYSQGWIEQLAIHEMRHHVQIDKIESELPAIFKILLGEQAASIVIGAYLPFWFLEGDAVVSETALSHTGRGRLPSFSMELKAQADQKGIYSFDKAYLGSYKDYIPDYYQLGYQMVSNIRNQHGGEVWGKVLHHVARNPLGLTSLSKGLKLATGKNQDEHYLSVMKNLQTTNPFNFDNQDDTASNYLSVTGATKYYTSYRYPNFVDDSTFIALKTSLNKIPEIVQIDGRQNEKRLFTPGMILDESMSYSDGKIAWMELRPDPRWTYRDKSLLRILNIHTGKLKETVYSEKLFAPVISPDGRWIAAVRYDDLNSCSIVLINSENEEIEKYFKATGHCEFQTPSWSSDSEALYAIELGSAGKAIIRLNTATGEMNRLTSPTFGDIKKPVQRGNYLFYSANDAGINEGYALDLTTGKSYLAARAKYGIKDLRSSSDGSKLLYSDYTANGFKIVKKRILRSEWKENIAGHRFQDTLSVKLTAQENGAIDFSSLDTGSFVSTKYPKFKNLINIHSWSPIYIDPDQSVVNAGFSIISQNKLSTAITQLGYDYSTVNHTGKWIGKFEYAGWYPVMKLYADYGKESSSYYQINKNYNTQNQTTEQDTISVPYTQKVLNLHMDASLPFNISHGKMYRLVQPEIQLGYSYYWQEPTTPSAIFSGSYIPVTYRLYAHNIIQRSTRDVQARWGQVMDLHYRNTPWGNRQKGIIVAAEGSIYFPGLFESHGLRFYGGYQEKKSDASYFNDIISYPRGYMNQENIKMVTFRSDYVLPLLSPDWKIWRLYYLKRVTLRIHYDQASIISPIYHSKSTFEDHISSTGGELLTECHFLRFIAPVKIGFRESYLIESKTVTSEFLFSVNFNGM